MRPALLAALLILGAPLVPVLSAAPSYTYIARDCDYAYWLAPTTTAAAWREHVPARFAIVGEEAGAAVAVVTFVECTFYVNGGAGHRARLSDVGVSILSPIGATSTLDFFHLWQVTDSPELAALNAAWGIPGGTGSIRGEPGEFFPVAPVTAGWGSVVSNVGTYGATAYHSPAHEAAPGTAIWWRESDAGVTRIEQAFLTGLAEADGAGEIWTANGPTAELIPHASMYGFPGAPAVSSVSYTDLYGTYGLSPS